MNIVAYGQRLDPCFVCKNSRTKIFCKHCNGVGQIQFNIYQIEGVEYGHGTDDNATTSDSIDRIIANHRKS